MVSCSKIVRNPSANDFQNHLNCIQFPHQRCQSPWLDYQFFSRGISINLHFPRLHPGWGVQTPHPRNPHTWRNAKTVGGFASFEAVKRQGLNLGYEIGPASWNKKTCLKCLQQLYKTGETGPYAMDDWGYSPYKWRNEKGYLYLEDHLM